MNDNTRRLNACAGPFPFKACRTAMIASALLVLTSPWLPTASGQTVDPGTTGAEGAGEPQTGPQEVEQRSLRPREPHHSLGGGILRERNPDGTYGPPRRSWEFLNESQPVRRETSPAPVAPGALPGRPRSPVGYMAPPLPLAVAAIVGGLLLGILQEVCRRPARRS